METAKQIVTTYIESVWNQGDLDALERLTAESFTYTLGSQPARDKVGMREFLQAVRIAFPDWIVGIQTIVSDATTVAVRWSGQVTHNGPFLGVPPTGKSVHVCGINVYEIDNGKILREWEQMDSLGLLQQLGVLPPSRPSC